MTHCKSLFLLALSSSIAACDAFDMPEDHDPSAAETSGGKPNDDDAPTDEPDPSTGESTGSEDMQSSESSGELPDSTGSDAPADVPDGLLGLWSAGGASGMSTLELSADGSYVYASRTQQSLGTCTYLYELAAAGEIAVTGNVLVLHPTSHHRRTESCGTVEETEELPDDSVYTWELGADAWGESLTLTLEGGAGPVVYHRG